MALKLNVIVASTRPGRVGIHVGHWFHEVASEHAAFDATLVDLAEVGLPIYDEPVHPRQQKYQHEHTKRWSEIVAAADAYAFVMPEYNFNMSPALVNALDFVYVEWGYKPAGIVSYGGVSGGLRAAQVIKGQFSAMKIVPMAEAVVIPFVAKQVEDGVFTPKDEQVQGAAAMLDEMARWAEALKPLRK